MVQELNAKNFKEFHVPGDSAERHKMRFKHYEIRRRQKIERVLKERECVIDEAFRSASPHINPLVSSKLVKSLIDKEKANLARSVRFHLQLKRFYHKEANNRREKKRKLSKKRKLRENQVAAAEERRKERADQLREIIRARFGVRDQVLHLNEIDYSRKKEEWISKQVDEELQSEHFKKSLELSRSQKSELWAEKYREIQARVACQEDEEKKKRDAFMEKLSEKFDIIEERKQQSIHSQQLRGEEVNLRLMDALSRKQQQDRLDQARREQIAAIIEKENKRAGLIKYLKQNIRKSKLLVQSIHHTAEMNHIVPLAREGTQPPGPADYTDIVSWLDLATGPRFSESDTNLAHIPGTIDFMVTHAKSIPSAYDVRVLPDGSKPWAEQPVLKWSTTKKESYVDTLQANKSEIPGPASYEATISALSPNGPKISPDIVPREDVRNRRWINGNADPSLPGPTTYTVDEFTRIEALDLVYNDYTSVFKSVITETEKNHTQPPTVNIDELTI